MPIGIDPTVDIVFKRLFGTEENASILIHFLNSVLGEAGGRRIVSVEFRSPVHDRETEDDKLVIVDVRVRDDAGRQILVEMQVILHKAFKERMLYYWAKDFAQQLGPRDDYRGLAPTILVCIVVGELFPETRDYRNRFRLVSDDRRLVFSDRLEIHTLELGKFHRAPEQIESRADGWAYFIKHGKELDPQSLPATMQDPEYRAAAEVLNMISQSERDRVAYEMREKRRRDMINRDELIHEGGRDLGREEGRAEGREEGREEGILIGQVQLLQRLLGENQTPKEELQRNPSTGLNAMIEALQTRLRNRHNDANAAP